MKPLSSALMWVTGTKRTPNVANSVLCQYHSLSFFFYSTERATMYIVYCAYDNTYIHICWWWCAKLSMNHIFTGIKLLHKNITLTRQKNIFSFSSNFLHSIFLLYVYCALEKPNDFSPWQSKCKFIWLCTISCDSQKIEFIHLYTILTRTRKQKKGRMNIKLKFMWPNTHTHTTHT